MTSPPESTSRHAILVVSSVTGSWPRHYPHSAFAGAVGVRVDDGDWATERWHLVSERRVTAQEASYVILELALRRFGTILAESSSVKAVTSGAVARQLAGEWRVHGGRYRPAFHRVASMVADVGVPFTWIEVRHDRNPATRHAVDALRRLSPCPYTPPPVGIVGSEPVR